MNRFTDQSSAIVAAINSVDFDDTEQLKPSNSLRYSAPCIHFTAAVSDGHYIISAITWTCVPIGCEFTKFL